MFIVQLKFFINKSKASQYMEEHKLWIKKGIEDNIFLLVGSIKPNLGGLIIVHNISLQELEEKIHKESIYRA